jgi:hypothetical protein
LQYCYAHLLREVESLEKEFPDAAKAKAFAGTLAPLLALAMGLRNQQISDKSLPPVPKLKLRSSLRSIVPPLIWVSVGSKTSSANILRASTIGRQTAPFRLRTTLRNETSGPP